MDMPNNNPPVCSQELLANKFAKAAEDSLANYSFYIGASNDNLPELLATDPRNVCGIKAVSYTHLDVYKRQQPDFAQGASGYGG